MLYEDAAEEGIESNIRYLSQTAVRFYTDIRNSSTQWPGHPVVYMASVKEQTGWAEARVALLLLVVRHGSATLKPLASPMVEHWWQWEASSSKPIGVFKTSLESMGSSLSHSTAHEWRPQDIIGHLYMWVFFYIIWSFLKAWVLTWPNPWRYNRWHAVSCLQDLRVKGTHGVFPCSLWYLHYQTPHSNWVQRR